MANQEHLDILRQGAVVWNQWREEHPDIQPDLSDAYFGGTNLYDLNLSNANLIDADLSEANLLDTNLSDADLSSAIVGFTVFGNVDLSVVKGLETVHHIAS